jgi:hypothetical protein
MKIQLVAAMALVSLLSATGLVEAKPVETPSAPVVNNVEMRELTAEINRLKAVIAEQQKQISQQQGVLQVLTQKGEGVNTALLTAAGVILASLLAGFFALRNQNTQAAQGRLLKAVELIMDSRSGYQADVRRQNLAVFLDATTKEHLKDIKTTFAGPEFTDIHIQLAESMASKAQSPKEALEIWQAVLKEKNVINKVKYP